MAQTVTLAIEAMGGDDAPQSIVEGVADSAKRRKHVQYLLYGDEADLAPLIARHSHLNGRVSLRHTEKYVAMDIKPSQAVRQGKGSSMWNALECVKSGEADAAVSAGNTGAWMAMSMFVLRLAPGVHRPAIAASWPTPRGPSVVLDMGAQLEADASQLVDFAIMGEAFSRAVHKKPNPSVGLLNIGSEEMKGHEELREAATILRDAKLPIDFKGFVEGDDISLGAVDVVVTDGFTGNIALKTAEGAAKLVSQWLKEALTSGPLAICGAALAAPALRKLRGRMDPRTFNGGVFLGVNGTVVKAHGGSDAFAFANAIDVAVELARSEFKAEVETNLERLAAQDQTTMGAAEAVS